MIRLRGTGGDWTHSRPVHAQSYAAALTFSVKYTPLTVPLSPDPF